jgi:hypothetical protein
MANTGIAGADMTFADRVTRYEELLAVDALWSSAVLFHLS